LEEAVCERHPSNMPNELERVQGCVCNWGAEGKQSTWWCFHSIWKSMWSFFIAQGEQSSLHEHWMKNSCQKKVSPPLTKCENVLDPLLLSSAPSVIWLCRNHIQCGCPHANSIPSWLAHVNNEKQETKGSCPSWNEKLARTVKLIEFERMHICWKCATQRAPSVLWSPLHWNGSGRVFLCEHARFPIWPMQSTEWLMTDCRQDWAIILNSKEWLAFSKLLELFLRLLLLKCMKQETITCS